MLAFAATALICDIWTGTQTETWLPDAGPADDRLYLSFIVRCVGITQLLTLIAEIPHRESNKRRITLPPHTFLAAHTRQGGSLVGAPDVRGARSPLSFLRRFGVVPDLV